MVDCTTCVYLTDCDCDGMIQYGDVTCDGTPVSVNDITLISNYLYMSAEEQAANPIPCFAAADFDGDGIIDIADLLYMIHCFNNPNWSPTCTSYVNNNIEELQNRNYEILTNFWSLSVTYQYCVYVLFFSPA